MSTIGVWDNDYFTYEHVIPNLDCAKLVTYYRNHKHIAVLTPTLNPGPYTRYFYRKEYNDGIFPKDVLLLPNCEYGGRAFTPKKYIPFAPEIEETVPDMHIYDKYLRKFGRGEKDQRLIKHILNCANMRLSSDSEHINSLDSYKKYFELKPTGIILHDYDLAALKPYDFIIEMQNQRRYVTKEGINPYPVGNKYPIRVTSSEELEKWLHIVAMSNTLSIQYQGLMNDEVLNKLCVDNLRIARQIYYDVTWGCSSENEFLMERLPKIFLQCLFLRSTNVKILLLYDENFLKTRELRLLMDLLNCWVSFKITKNYPSKCRNLYYFCRLCTRATFEDFALKHVIVSVEEEREVFYYMREHNYELFKLFYELNAVGLKGGNLVNEG